MEEQKLVCADQAACGIGHLLGHHDISVLCMEKLIQLS